MMILLRKSVSFKGMKKEERIRQYDRYIQGLHGL